MNCFITKNNEKYSPRIEEKKMDNNFMEIVVSISSFTGIIV